MEGDFLASKSLWSSLHHINDPSISFLGLLWLWGSQLQLIFLLIIFRLWTRLFSLLWEHHQPSFFGVFDVAFSNECNDEDGILGIGKIFKLRNQLLSQWKKNPNIYHELIVVFCSVAYIPVIFIKVLWISHFRWRHRRRFLKCNHSS